MTALEDNSIDGALVLGPVRKGDSAVVFDSDLTLAELESRRICLGSVLTSVANSFPSFRTTVEELISPGKISDSSSSRVSKKVSGPSVTAEIFSSGPSVTTEIFSWVV